LEKPDSDWHDSSPFANRSLSRFLSAEACSTAHFWAVPSRLHIERAKALQVGVGAKADRVLQSSRFVRLVDFRPGAATTNRIRGILPLAARRAQLLAEFEQLRNAPDLAESARDERIHCSEKIALAQHRRRSRLRLCEHDITEEMRK
jgi:hypothetical protein